MQVRWKAPTIGDVVRVKDGEMYFRLPHGLPDGTDGVLVGRDSGVYIVRALGQDWKIPFQCVVHEEEEFLDDDGFGNALVERFPRITVTCESVGLIVGTAGCGRHRPRSIECTLLWTGARS